MAKTLFRLGFPFIWLGSNLKYRRYTRRHGPEIIDAVLAQPLTTLWTTAAELEAIEYFVSTVPAQLGRRKIPVTVVASGQALGRHQLPGSSSAALARYTAIHQQLQKDLIKLSCGAEFILDKYSAHNVPVDNPDLLIREIRKVASKIRLQ
jgi:pimeloyl-ACP methyl ester carboxylesterase